MLCGLCNDNFLARFMQLNTTATGTSLGYDDVFAEPNLVSAGADDAIGTVGRSETQYDVRVQVDEVQGSDKLRQTSTGKSRDAKLELIASKATLTALSLIDTDGQSLIRTGARLDRITDLAGNAILVYADPPGLFVDEITYDAWTEESYGMVMFTLSPRQRNT